MFIIKVESSFSAAHNLRGYKGKCESLHGHNWKVEVAVKSGGLNETGMVVDFHVVKAALNKTLGIFDHAYLNKIPCFKKINPTSENIARYIYSSLKPHLRGLSSVTVWENSTCSAVYYEE